MPFWASSKPGPRATRASLQTLVVQAFSFGGIGDLGVGDVAGLGGAIKNCSDMITFRRNMHTQTV
jgi:hypothetical protein